MKNRQNRKLWTPVIEFTAHDGRQILFSSSVSTSWRGYGPGDRVRVIYNPSLPDEAEIASFARLWLTPVTLIGIGIALVGVSIYILAYA